MYWPPRGLHVRFSSFAPAPCCILYMTRGCGASILVRSGSRSRSTPRSPALAPCLFIGPSLLPRARHRCAPSFPPQRLVRGVPIRWLRQAPSSLHASPGRPRRSGRARPHDIVKPRTVGREGPASVSEAPSPVYWPRASPHNKGHEQTKTEWAAAPGVSGQQRSRRPSGSAARRQFAAQCPTGFDAWSLVRNCSTTMPASVNSYHVPRCPREQRQLGRTLFQPLEVCCKHPVKERIPSIHSVRTNPLDVKPETKVLAE